ncbi:type 1 glutamine amidotransferase [Corallococcus sp. AB004]|uniref:type 1 glutamine amidotransferase domain-containing protein n=1 Tax=Corallococcus sp. AB038B TaxID=2316718 RepID=UPI000EA156D4|nr:type 1 glutamine amidotransferase domain-containing protein [Corallococcus sp. AB038B]RKH92883.1 type 1 glutamine amidotransferase [Corallococcus sp. AB038B]RKI29738.1 type 1 glutamine amidotransferase [Corallococcus sp. AB004]
MARIAFIVANDFEDSEFQVPFDTLKQAGHEPVVIGVEAGKTLKGKKGAEIRTEKAVKEVKAADFAALVIPGGYSPDHLRMDIGMVGFVRDFFKADKTIAAVCHGPWMLVEADIADERTVTSFPSIKTDLINAGARWVDRQVVEDGNLITSRKPDDLEAFCAAVLRQLKDGIAPRLESPLAPQATADRAPPVH